MMLTIGISTVSSNLGKLLPYLFECVSTFDNMVNFLVVSQSSTSNKEYLFNNSRNIKVYEVISKGLSISRNEVIKRCDTKWLWFQDDDIILNVSNVKVLLAYLDKTKNKIILPKIGSLENRNEYYKDYSFHSKHSFLNCMKVSSIEIIIDVDFVKSNEVFFDERFGLGSNLPCCEENIFVKNIFDTTVKVGYLDLVVCYHTTLLENRNIDYKNRFIARGNMLKTFPFFLSILLIIRWSVTIKTDEKRLKNFYLMLRTYLKGEIDTKK